MSSCASTQIQLLTPKSFTYSPTSSVKSTPKPKQFLRPTRPSKIHVLKSQFQHDKAVLGPSLLGSSETPLLQTRFADALEYAMKRESLAGRRGRTEELPFPVRVGSRTGWPASPTEQEEVMNVQQREVRWCVDVAVQERRAQLGSTTRKQARVYRIEGMDVGNQYGRVYV